MYLTDLQTDTVAAGVIVGISGQSAKDEDPVLDNVANVTFPAAPSTSYDPDDTQAIKGTYSVYNIMMDRFYLCLHVLLLSKIFCILTFTLILFSQTGDSHSFYSVVKSQIEVVGNDVDSGVDTCTATTTNSKSG